MISVSDILLLIKSDISTDNYIQFSKAIQYLNEQYYSQSNQVISDQEFDILFQKVKDFEANIEVKDKISETVAKGISLPLSTVQHSVPMLSLSNSYNAEDLYNFDISVRKELPNAAISYYVEPKFDGSSIALLYQDNVLVRAATRGDGTQGEDITDNAKEVQNILVQADFKHLGYHEVELRGEVVIKKKNFEAMNQLRDDAGLSTFQNPRNTASGSLRLKDSNELKNRYLEAFIYSIGYLNPDKMDGPLAVSQENNITFLKKIGFNSADGLGKKCQNIEEVIDFCNEWELKRPNYEFEIDGMVIKVNSIAQQSMLGTTSHHPKWAIAYKFKAIEQSTKLVDIEYQVGRTGIITPVAKVHPVAIGGVTVRSISLHNEDNIISKDIHLGDNVYVERAGDVIPQITRVNYEQRDLHSIRQFKFIETCPSCHSRLIRREGEAAWRCISIDCGAQNIEKIIYFASKDAMNIKGLGKDIIKRFVELGIIKNIIDIYKIDYQHIESLEGWQSKSVESLKQSINDSKSNELYRLLVALGIDNVGVTMSKSLAKKVNHIRDFITWTKEDFNNIDDIGDKMAQSLSDFFEKEEHQKLIDELETLGLNLHGTPQVINGKLSQEVIVFTGFRDSNLEQKIESLGGVMSNSLSKKTTILLMKEKGSGSTKETKAINFGAKIMTIQEFLDWLKQ